MDKDTGGLGDGVPEPAPESEPERGAGAGDTPAIRDTRLQERAIRERWPMSADVRIKVLKRLCKIVDDDAWPDPDERPSQREVISAAKALISADKLNLDQAKLDHATRPPEQLDDDFEVDIAPPEDPPLEADGPAA